ncbi:hypothetical protein BaRGS_00015789 [Batillaria attramentaria]|uniref:Uncharacterized protein n=1 Tax=Batillaria attramentaria TaxID=370345 RepID=A0ABD0L1T2_9CAEN
MKPGTVRGEDQRSSCDRGGEKTIRRTQSQLTDDFCRQNCILGSEGSQVTGNERSRATKEAGQDLRCTDTNHLADYGSRPSGLGVETLNPRPLSLSPPCPDKQRRFATRSGISRVLV